VLSLYEGSISFTRSIDYELIAHKIRIPYSCFSVPRAPLIKRHEVVRKKMDGL
jgi:hypothetical protein